jgi:hypothetical protein
MTMSDRDDLATGRRGHEEGGGGAARATVGNRQKDPDDWKTGDEPMTGAQASYLETLSHEAGERFDADERLTKAEAAKRIDELQQKTGRGLDRPQNTGRGAAGDSQ